MHLISNRGAYNHLFWLSLYRTLTMQIDFRFDFPRTLSAITYIASKDIPELTKYKILKLIFWADKYHLVRYGRPITGDKYFALPQGPVASLIYDLLEQVEANPYSQEAKRLAENLEVDHRYANPRFKAKRAFDAEALSRSDIAALDKVITEYGQMKFEELRALSHATPAYERAWNSRGLLNKRARINFEDFFDEDADALAGAKEEMLENFSLRRALEKSRLFRSAAAR